MLHLKFYGFCCVQSFGKIMIPRQKHWTEIRAELLSHLKGEVQMHGGFGGIDMGRRKWDPTKFWPHVGERSQNMFWGIKAVMFLMFCICTVVKISI